MSLYRKRNSGQLFPSLLLLILAPLCLASSSSAEGVAPPKTAARNIIFILIDDQRYDSFGFMGHPFLETPHLDRLASSGVQFVNAFVTTSLCSPSRASILSGQYAHRHGVLDNNTRLPADTPTFPKELQKAGYDTAFIGKWHMGGSSDEPRPGFNRWVSFRGQGVYYNPTLNVDGERVKREGYLTDMIAEYAVDFINKDRQSPFFLYVSHKAVHAMFEPAERHKGCYKDKKYVHPDSMADTDENYRGKPAWVRAQRDSWHGVDGMYNGAVEFDTFVRDYAETLRAVDDSVGAILEALREKGILDETLLIYTSDNGFLFGEHGHIDKRSMYEESIRVPLLVHCPALVKGGQKRDEMIVNVDYAPTILEAAGLDVPQTVQGRSFYGLLDGSEKRWRDAFLYEYFWERSFPQTPTVLGVRTDTHKLMRYHGIWDRYELYDLEKDPKEMNNLLADFTIEHEAGTLDDLIRRNADDGLKELFAGMTSSLDGLLQELECESEPNWRPAHKEEGK